MIIYIPYTCLSVCNKLVLQLNKANASDTEAAF